MAGRLACRSSTLQRLMGRCLLLSRPNQIVSTKQVRPMTNVYHKNKISVHVQSSSTTQIIRNKSTSKKDKDTSQKSLMLARKLFENTPPEALNKENYKSVVDTFTSFDVRNRGYLQFIEIGLKNMKKYGVEKDADAYNLLLDLFPKGPLVPKNFFMSIMNHAPEQQSMGMKIMQQMEENTVMPNRKTREILLAVFGQHSHPVKQYMRIMYWFPKFWNLNPFPLPEELPKDYKELCHLGLKRIADYDARLSISYLKGSYPDSENPEFIATMQSHEQQEMLAQQPVNKALYVEGAFTLWLRKVQMSYFILRGDPFTMEEPDEDTDREDLLSRDSSLQEHRASFIQQGTSQSSPNAPDPIQEGPVFAMCMTTNQTEETLRRWVQTLQEENPHLANIPVYFNLFNLDKGEHHVSELIGNDKLIESS